MESKNVQYNTEVLPNKWVDMGNSRFYFASEKIGTYCEWKVIAEVHFRQVYESLPASWYVYIANNLCSQYTHVEAAVEKVESWFGNHTPFNAM